MKKFVLQIILIIMGLSFLNFLSPSTCKVYKGTSTYSSDVICNLKDGKIYKGNSSYSSDVLVTIRDNRYTKVIPHIVATYFTPFPTERFTKGTQVTAAT
ncbi:MAG: hypothetical protein IKK40_02510, partial [Bacteroidales bacterium]|nr:hypothetical protein [Bacteroidales bacterium]